MGTNVSLTPELERFAQSCVKSGRYNSVSEVVRSGLRMMQEREEQRLAFIKTLDDAIAEGERDGFFTIEQVRADALAAIGRVKSREE